MDRKGVGLNRPERPQEQRTRRGGQPSRRHPNAREKTHVRFWQPFPALVVGRRLHHGAGTNGTADPRVERRPVGSERRKGCARGCGRSSVVLSIACWPQAAMCRRRASDGPQALPACSLDPQLVFVSLGGANTTFDPSFPCVKRGVRKVVGQFGYRRRMVNHHTNKRFGMTLNANVRPKTLPDTCHFRTQRCEPQGLPIMNMLTPPNNRADYPSFCPFFPMADRLPVSARDAIHQTTLSHRPPFPLSFAEWPAGWPCGLAGVPRFSGAGEVR